jgi:very-short-patch-repair endonuclease
VYSHTGQPRRVLRIIRKRHRGLMVGLRHAQSPATLWLTADHYVLCQQRAVRYGTGRGWGGVPAGHFERARKLRNDSTPAERALWPLLSREQMGVKFRRQHPLGPYIADFYSREVALVLELDGDSHASPNAQAYDAERTRYLNALGLNVLRFTNAQAAREREAVLAQIQSAVQAVRPADQPGQQWRRADTLLVGDVVYFRPEKKPVEIVSLEHEETEEDVYDLEVESDHSFLTEVCAIHNCGSGTTAYVAEQWGRRWITIDTSRVPLALARQRLLTATFPYYELQDEKRGPAGGFVYKRKQNKRGEEVGGIVPHITLKSIANDEPPAEEVLVDRPEVASGVTRVTGPFTLEATIPTPAAEPDSGRQTTDDGSYPARMLEALRRVATLRLPDNRAITFHNIRPPARSLSLSAEAVVDTSAPGQKPSLMDVVDEAEEKSGRRLPLSQKPVAFVFGPENGAVTETLVFQAAREAYAKSYTHLYVLGFAIQPNARQLIENCETAVGLPASYVQATPDLMMGDLLKNLRSSQIFSVVGSPDIKLTRLKRKSDDGDTLYRVELLGLDVFDPVKLETDHRRGDDVPAWFLDADYNDLCFHVSQAFFPRTGAWENLKRALKGAYEDSVWDHLAGTVSEPFSAGEREQIAVKVIDDRGNELLVVKKLSEAEREK